MRRQALHEGPLDIATKTQPHHVPIDVRIGQEAVVLDYEEGVLMLKDGEEIVSDMVVVANSLHSNRQDHPYPAKPDVQYIALWCRVRK